MKKISLKHGLSTDFEWIEDLQIMLFSHLVEPKLKALPLCFIYDYPKQQSALAKTKDNIVNRFELYCHGIEVANGYDELQNATEYQKIFISDICKRQQLK